MVALSFQLMDPLNLGHRIRISSAHALIIVNKISIAYVSIIENVPRFRVPLIKSERSSFSNKQLQDAQLLLGSPPHADILTHIDINVPAGLFPSPGVLASGKYSMIWTAVNLLYQPLYKVPPLHHPCTSPELRGRFLVPFVTMRANNMPYVYHRVAFEPAITLHRLATSNQRYRQKTL